MSPETPNGDVDCHGPLANCPIFFPETGTEIMFVHFRDDGFVEIAVEGVDESERLETRIITRDDYQELFSAQP